MGKRDSPSVVLQGDTATTVLEEPAHRLRSLEQEARQLMETGQYLKALHLRMQGVALAQLSLTDPTAASVESSEVVAEAHLRLCDNYHHLGFAEQVSWHAQKAIEFCEPTRSERDLNDVLASAYHYMAKGLILKGEFDCVPYYLHKALSLNHKLHGEEDASNTPLHLSFSDYYVHWEESLQDKRNCESGMVEIVDAEELTETKGMDLSQSDNYTKAIGELQKAWQLIHNAQSTEDLDKPCERGSLQKSKAVIYTKIAQILTKQGMFQQAAEHYEKAISLYADAIPHNAQGLASLNHELNGVYHKLRVSCT